MTTSNHNVDSLDSLLDFSEYDNMSYQSPSLSPAATSKNTFTRPSVSTVATPTMPSASQPLTGPSHQYDLYKQQTGIVPGALASTLAVNEVNPHISGYNSSYGMEYLGAGLSPENDLFDFNTSPSQNSTGLDMDMEFESPPDSQYFFPNPTVNPSAIAGQESPVVPSQQSTVGRLWPGMHSQAALAKAQAQQRQQQQIIQQQQRHQQMSNKPRTKSQQPTDPIVEHKITQLLNSMRAKPAQEGDSPSPLMNLPRSKKDEEDMDEDERLLASEEGKKLSSKERRQLRNKVSARAFRSRRKEYITQLEAEIANKVSENGDLRVHNRALQDENKRLQDLTRMLLASPSFSNFLDHLSTNPQAAPQPAAAVKVERQPEQRQIPKDINPYANQGQQQQQIGMAMVPEQNMDFAMLNIDNDAYNFQPQVFAVLETPDVPVTIDSNVLSGKSSNFVGENFESDDEKIDIPAIEAPKSLAPELPSQAPAETEVFDDEFENDPEFALYHSSPALSAEGPAEPDKEGFSHIGIFGGVETEKVLARYDLVDASEEEQNACVAMARVQRLAASLEPVLARLESLVL
ncbi:BZIP-type transcription factor MBZ1 [Colletotrichum shisoi]|uniref:BZIP-type transcription factor MBZ1 n=1 Tax=Colletotrichum shisoi TaxID=2078593 RepID=A0A5Q4BSC8_9PEZI|nr:BZIP-type transcription factor MBZ1 [Colletotrichum shisoi]